MNPRTNKAKSNHRDQFLKKILKSNEHTGTNKYDPEDNGRKTGKSAMEYRNIDHKKPEHTICTDGTRKDILQFPVPVMM